MVTTTKVGQLSEECNIWRNSLRSFREHLTTNKALLRQVAGRQTLRDDLLEIEHFDNQFHIHLINIHDLKQAIKHHDRKALAERISSNSAISDETLARHEKLYEEYLSLQTALHVVSGNFTKFMEHIR
ncbi:MAG: hypothetical protein ABI687_11035 [Flavitalea sp.]